MSFSPARIQSSGPPLVGARKETTHNKTVRRIYKNWTPEDLAVVERVGPRTRATIYAMVGPDYTDVIYATSLLLLNGSAAFHARGKPWPVELRRIQRERNLR